jgi:serine/threonine protein kinase
MAHQNETTISATLAGNAGVPHEATSPGAPDFVEPAAAHAKRVGKFILLRQLGEGGMGVVYSAYDTELDREVALKFLHSGADEARHLRLQREARAMAKLSHPNVVQVFEVGTHEGQVYIVMEHIHGETLKRWLSNGEQTRTLNEKLDVLIQVASGLSCAHEAGLIHRDIKPDNIMVGKDGRVRVLDFGLVRDGDSSGPVGAAQELNSETTTLGDSQAPLTREGSVLGTPAYMSPEQIDQQPLEPTSDQFSFCIVAYELLLGRRPFVGSGIRQTLVRIATKDPAPIEDEELDPWLRAAILKGLEKKQEHRHPSLACLRDLLEGGRRSAAQDSVGMSPWPMLATVTIGSLLFWGATAFALRHFGLDVRALALVLVSPLVLGPLCLLIIAALFAGLNWSGSERHMRESTLSSYFVAPLPPNDAFDAILRNAGRAGFRVDHHDGASGQLLLVNNAMTYHCAVWVRADGQRSRVNVHWHPNLLTAFGTGRFFLRRDMANLMSFFDADR